MGASPGFLRSTSRMHTGSALAFPGCVAVARLCEYLRRKEPMEAPEELLEPVAAFPGAVLGGWEFGGMLLAGDFRPAWLASVRMALEAEDGGVG